MTLNSIRLQNFRSYKDESFEFSSGVNIVVGPNASGKTNLLEAVLVACTGRSYRAKDHELVGFDCPWARVDVLVADEPRVVKLVSRTPLVVEKTISVGANSYKRLSHSKTIPVVVFEPQHLLLLSGSPELRRAFIDDLLERLNPEFGAVRRHYKRTLAQRNALLKSGRNNANLQLFAWNVRLSELGGQIVAWRLELLERLNGRLADLYSSIARLTAKVEFVYDGTCTSDRYSTEMLRNLEKNTELDLQRGFTSCGPHRDDITIYLNEHRSQQVASRGEIRTLVLSLKILELQFLHDTRGQQPVLLLDDVFSELDGARRRTLTQYLQPYQTFITTTDADVVVQHFMQDCNIIPISSTS